MKTLVLSMISIAATVAAMTACTSESDEIDNVVEAPVEIQAKAGVGSITTKASMDNWDEKGTKVFFCRAKDDATAADWSTATPLFAKIENKTDIVFYKEEARTTADKQYYNADATLKSWMIGCHLGGAAITGGTNLTNNKATITITGQEDIMATAPQSGSKTTNDGFKEFTFSHLLSKLSFLVEPATGQDAAAVQNAFGEVTKIEVLEQPYVLDLELSENNSLIKNATTSPNSKTFDVSGNVTIAANQLFGESMVLPNSTLGITATPLKIKVYTAKADKGLDVDVTIGDGTKGLVANTEYKVKLAFSTSDITATATIGKWTIEEGSGTVK